MPAGILQTTCLSGRGIMMSYSTFPVWICLVLLFSKTPCSAQLNGHIPEGYTCDVPVTERTPCTSSDNVTLYDKLCNVDGITIIVDFPEENPHNASCPCPLGRQTWDQSGSISCDRCNVEFCRIHQLVRSIADFEIICRNEVCCSGSVDDIKLLACYQPVPISEDAKDTEPPMKNSTVAMTTEPNTTAAITTEPTTVAMTTEDLMKQVGTSSPPNTSLVVTTVLVAIALSAGLIFIALTVVRRRKAARGNQGDAGERQTNNPSEPQSPSELEELYMNSSVSSAHQNKPVNVVKPQIHEPQEHLYDNVPQQGASASGGAQVVLKPPQAKIKKVPPKKPPASCTNKPYVNIANLNTGNDDGPVAGETRRGRTEADPEMPPNDAMYTSLLATARDDVTATYEGLDRGSTQDAEDPDALYEAYDADAGDYVTPLPPGATGTAGTALTPSCSDEQASARSPKPRPSNSPRPKIQPKPSNVSLKPDKFVFNTQQEPSGADLQDDIYEDCDSDNTKIYQNV